MPFAAALSTAADTDRALDEVCERARPAGEPGLALVFFTPPHAEAAGRIATTLHDRLRPRCLIGCPGESVVGIGREVEHQPALSLWLGRWPAAVELEAFHLSARQTPDGLSLFGWPDGLIESDPAGAALLVLADPYTFPAAELFLPRVNEDYPGLRVMGGMASGPTAPGRTPLVLGPEVHTTGAVGVWLRGPVGLRGVVSQGCRPIGRPLVVTKAHDNLITELGGRTPLEQLRDIWQGLGPHDRELFQRGLHIGLVIDEYREQFRRGDFLVRNLYGLDQASGALAITDRVRVGQTVQFQVRDADTAGEDLRELLRADRAAHPRSPAGALLFTCNGRGTRLFGAPDHDAMTLQVEMGAVPVAGFFAAGELGPVGGRNFLHGFTASVAVFEE